MIYSPYVQLAGVVAVEITGGPDVPFHPGREVGEVVSYAVHLLLFYTMEMLKYNTRARS